MGITYSKTFLQYINVITVKLKNHEHQEYLCNVILLQGNNQSGVKKKIKLQKATVISLWFRGLLMSPELDCDWSL